MGAPNSFTILGFRTKSQTLSLAASSSGATAQPSSATSVTLSSTVQPCKRLNRTLTHTRRRLEIQKLRTEAFSATAPAPEHALQPEQISGTFEDMVTGSDTAVLVDFYAPWCGPCELMSRVIMKLSTELKGDLKVVKVNTDSYPKLASKYRIQALPTCLLFRDGTLIDRVNGYMPESSFGKRVRFYVARLDKKFGRR